jgi:hypothetical protein
MNKQYAQTGTNTVVAGGTAETVELGFKPSYVKAFNVNNLASYEHWDGMDDDTDITTITDGTMSVNAAGGITLTSNGFTLGTDICDTTADVVRWVAIR